MSNTIRHVLGISGGKDSAALALYLSDKYPELPIEYYFCDTGKELKETYELIEKLQSELKSKIKILEAAHTSHKDPFDHFLSMYRGFLPSSNARWCTNKLKLEPFENFVGNDPVISYVAIRDDEDREGYISKKSNIQSVFPFRKNVWSQDVINLILSNSNISPMAKLYADVASSEKLDRAMEIINTPVSPKFMQHEKLKALHNIGIKNFNRAVFLFLKETNYPVSLMADFPLLENEEGLNRSDIFNLLETSSVGVPKYYKELEFEQNGKKGVYARSRSGCFFCFFQQRIEWIWLYEQHPELFKKAMEYEKDGYTWIQGETLEQLVQPERMNKIKEDQIRNLERKNKNNSPYLIDLLEDAETEGCAACFI
jgi:3'-phosphoadenosine 5'-phosphosulfate sulfotransferase (PAPS reductase)/FAD synthetase